MICTGLISEEDTMNRLTWFTHDANAHDDSDLRALIRKHGHRGDTIYWCLIEELFKHGRGNTARIAVSDLANKAITGARSVLDVVSTLGAMGKVSSEIERTKFGVYIVYEIPKLRERLKKLKFKSSSKVPEKFLKSSIEREGERERERVGKKTRFAPPPLSEVKKYCSDRGGIVNAEKWFDYYASNGWKVGKNTMKDWRASVRKWEHDEKEKNDGPRTKDGLRLG